jgi:hypothetical protein
MQQHAQAGIKKKEKDSISETKSSTTFHKGRIYTKSTSPLTSSRAKYDQSSLHQSKTKTTKED